ncbi:MAG: hypothetical protein AAFV95_15675 [Bacteroidota bacterium]
MTQMFDGDSIFSNAAHCPAIVGRGFELVWRAGRIAQGAISSTNTEFSSNLLLKFLLYAFFVKVW